MSLDLLQEIEQAEKKAEDARQEAVKEARDMLKSVEEACVSSERSATLEQRSLAQRVLEDAKATAQRSIEEMEKKQAEERNLLIHNARQRLEKASQFIFERVVNNGHR